MMKTKPAVTPSTLNEELFKPHAAQETKWVDFETLVFGAVETSEKEERADGGERTVSP